MLSAPELKVLLRAHGLRLTKRLGQHYLIDPNIVRRVVERCALSRNETVVEIGAGLGALTESLAERAGRVIAVDIDQGICSLLAERMRAYPNVSVVCQDILTFSWRCFTDVTVIGAIPYQVTSPILVALSESRRAIRKAVVILQREVAQRLIATPGTKAYGRLTLLGQYGWTITPVCSISRRAFFPEPTVDSSCLELVRRDQPPFEVANEPLFFEVVKAAFSQRRKTLVNCLSASPVLDLSRTQAETLVRTVGFSASVRGEMLSLGQFIALTNALSQLGSLR